MSFAGVEAAMAVIFKVTLPDYTMRFAEGGTVEYDGETFTSEDTRFGSVIAFEDFTSGNADEAPAFEMTLAPPAVISAATLSQPSYQGSDAWFSVVSYNRATGAVLTEHRLFTGILDYTMLELDRGRRELKVGFTTQIDRFFNTDKGNRLSPAFHKRIHPGETGLDYMSGTTIQIPWADNGPKPRINGYTSGLGNRNTTNPAPFVPNFGGLAGFRG